MAEEPAVLLGQGQIQTQLGPQGGAGRLRGAGAQQGVDRIPGGHPQQQEHQRGDQPEHHRSQGQTGGQVTRQVGTAAHGTLAAAAAGRRCSSPSITRPDPSNRGWLTLRWPQATGALSHTGT